MKKQHYESVVILNAALEDEQIDTTIKRIQETITTNGGEEIDIEKWGRKRLAYAIQKSKSGYYTIFRYVAPTESISNIERILNLDENIIRYLTVVLEKAALNYIAQQKEKAAAKVAEENQSNADSSNKSESKD